MLYPWGWRKASIRAEDRAVGVRARFAAQAAGEIPPAQRARARLQALPPTAVTPTWTVRIKRSTATAENAPRITDNRVPGGSSANRTRLSTELEVVYYV